MEESDENPLDLLEDDGDGVMETILMEEGRNLFRNEWEVLF